MAEDPRPQLLTERCATCVFRPDNRMHLRAGGLADLVAANLAAGTVLICHDTLPYGLHPDRPQAMCRGFWDAYAEDTPLVQVMARLFGPDWYQLTPPPPEEPAAD